jgi:hypothetical protein
MYHNKLVATIKSNGKVLREFKDTVYIPYSSEYSILLKNLNTLKAIVNVFIDGENVVSGGLVLYAGQEIELERSIKNNNLQSGNKFKFIEMTSNIEKHRGVKLEDGIIRVEYQFEKVYPTNPPLHWNMTGNPQYPRMGDVWSDSVPCGDWVGQLNGNITYTASNMAVGSASASISNLSVSSAANEAGITVAGSKSEQKFNTVSSFTLDATKHNIVLKLLGETEENKLVTKSVTVSHKPKCNTCGKQNKAKSKFCSECGTSLEFF